MNAEGVSGGGVSGPSGDSATRPEGFSIVVAMDRKRGIGYQGDLPWPKLKGDMRFFRELTTCPDRAAVEKRWGLKAEESAETKTWDEVSAMLKFAHPLPQPSWGNRNVVVMGRKTWESLPKQFRPLIGRHNMIFTRDIAYGDKNKIPRDDLTIVAGDVSGSVMFKVKEEQWLADQRPTMLRYVIGGGQVFLEALQQNYATCLHLYVTEIDAEFPCDTFFPETPDFKPVLSSPWIDEGGVRYRFRRYDRVS